MSNFNLPDTTWDGDPRAPWNEPETWEGRKCKECIHWRQAPKQFHYGWCTVEGEYYHRDNEACVDFEEE